MWPLSRFSFIQTKRNDIHLNNSAYTKRKMIPRIKSVARFFYSFAAPFIFSINMDLIVITLKTLISLINHLNYDGDKYLADLTLGLCHIKGIQGQDPYSLQSDLSQIPYFRAPFLGPSPFTLSQIMVPTPFPHAIAN